MDIQHTSIATATLLTQLLIALEREGVLNAPVIDDVMRESILLNDKEAGSRANLEAARFLQEVWESVRLSRG